MYLLFEIVSMYVNKCLYNGGIGYLPSPSSIDVHTASIILLVLYQIGHPLCQNILVDPPISSATHLSYYKSNIYHFTHITLHTSSLNHLSKINRLTFYRNCP